MSRNYVLFVDDEENILSSIKRGLIDQDYRCLFAGNGKQALKVLEEKEVSVVVTDMRMPEMNGLELLKNVQESYPDIVRVVISGYTQLPQIFAAINQGDIYKFIPKPWDLDLELKPIIEDSINQYNKRKQEKLLMEELDIKNSSYKNIIDSIKQVYSNLQNDMKILKDTSHFLLQELERKSIDKDIDTYSHLYRDYLDIVPTKKEHFQLERLMNSLNKRFSKKGFNTLVFTYKEEKNKYLQLNDNYQLIEYMLNSILLSLIDKQQKKEIPVTISSDEKESSVHCDFLIITSVTKSEGTNLTKMIEILGYQKNLFSHLIKSDLFKITEYVMNDILYVNISMDIRK